MKIEIEWNCSYEAVMRIQGRECKILLRPEITSLAATPREELLRQLLDSRIPKNEREWCAAREIEALRRGLAAVLELIEESYGVAGLHLNGDVASWTELRTGGRYDDWLFDFDQAVKRLPPNVADEQRRGKDNAH